MCRCQVTGLPNRQSGIIRVGGDMCCCHVCLNFCNRSSNWTSRSSVQVNGGVRRCLKTPARP